MIDYMAAFASEAAAQADPAYGRYYVASKGGNAWRGDICIPNVLVWAPAADTTAAGGKGETIKVHTPYDSQWRLIVSLPTRDSSLDNSAATQLVADRAVAATGNPAFLLKSTLTPTQLAALNFQPQFAGMGVYPFGNAALI
jgi:hypothetical protein